MVAEGICAGQGHMPLILNDSHPCAGSSRCTTTSKAFKPLNCANVSRQPPQSLTSPYERPEPQRRQPVRTRRRLATCALARVGRDRVQPHPRPQRPRVGLPRQSHHRQDPPATHHGPRPPRQVSPATGHTPTKGLALARQPGGARQLGLRATSPRKNLTTQPQQGATKDSLERPDRPAATPRRHGPEPIGITLTDPRILRRWIEAELVP